MTISSMWTCAQARRLTWINALTFENVISNLKRVYSREKQEISSRFIEAMISIRTLCQVCNAEEMCFFQVMWSKYNQWLSESELRGTWTQNQSVLFSPAFAVQRLSPLNYVGIMLEFVPVLFEIQLYLLFICYITFKKIRTIDFPIPFFLFRINS